MAVLFQNVFLNSKDLLKDLMEHDAIINAQKVIKGWLMGEKISVLLVLNM